MIIGNKDFDLQNKAPYIMGILNVTPDSFSDGGEHYNLDDALFCCEQMIKEGADIIDIGGESTRPNHVKISAEEEIDRVYKVIEKVRENFDTVISLDTYKPEVAKAFKGKIDIINDIWGLKYDESMADVVKDFGVTYILMHNRKSPDYTNFLQDVVSDIKESLEIADKHGISRDKIIVDAGIGFQKDYEQNLLLLNNLEILNRFGLPQMVATSRKSVLGLTLDVPPHDRDLATAITTTLGILKGAKFIRVHNVKANLEAIKITNSILEGKKWTK